MVRDAEERYRIESVVRACKILEAFRSESDRPRLQDLADRTDLSRSTALRLLRTLESCGYVLRTSPQHYRCLVRKRVEPRYRVAYTVNCLGKSFRREVSENLEHSAAEYDIELLSFEGLDDLRSATRFADKIIQLNVDLVIDYQTAYATGDMVAARYAEAGVPVIAVDIPHPGATYFGVNSYVAGRDGGRWLASWIRENWKSTPDTIVLLDGQDDGVLTSRVQGVVASLQAKLGPSLARSVIPITSKGLFEPSFRNIQSLLSKIAGGRTLVVCPTDPALMGALTALEEVGSRSEVIVFGLGGNAETRAALRTPGSRLIGCVGFFPENYARGLLAAAVSLIEKKPVPTAVFVNHQVLTRDNVDLIYPNDKATTLASRMLA